MNRIALQYPIPINGVVTHDITLRRPRVRDRLAAERTSGSDADRELALFATLIGCAPGELHEMDLADYRQVQEAFTGFLQSGPATSDASPPSPPATSTRP